LAVLPREFFERLLGYAARLQVVEYESDHAAMEALSRACLTWAADTAWDAERHG
jgi:hypothetical protein